MFILDTDILSATHYRNPPEALIAWIDSVPSAELWTTVITISEIQSGIEKMRAAGNPRVGLAEKWLRQVRSVVGVVPLNADAAVLLAGMHSHPEIRRMMQAGKGDPKVLPGADVMIGAIAISEGAVIATRNVRHFLQIHRHFALPGLYDPFGDVWHVRPDRQERLPL